MNAPMMSSMPMDYSQGTKKQSNPNNYKIVKCKNFEQGKKILKQMELVNMAIHVPSLMEILNSGLK